MSSFNFNSLQEAREFEEIQERMISNSMLVSMLGLYDSSISLQEAAKTNNKANSFLLALSSSINSYDLTSSEIGKVQQAGLQELVGAGAVTQQFADAVLDYTNNYKVYPYKDMTQVQFNNLRGIYTEKTVANFSNGKTLRLTLNETLTENCTLTLFDKDGEFGYQNLGRPTHLNPFKSVYKIKTNGLVVDGELVTRFPLENFNYTIEII